MASTGLDELIGAPTTPPLAWFQEKPPWMTPGTDIFIDLEQEPGRAAGYIAAWGSCIRGPGAPSECWMAPRSPTGGEYFNRRSVVTVDENGVRTAVRAGVVGMGHITAAGINEAANLHDDPSRQMLVGCYYEDDYGPYFVGAAVPEMTHRIANVINRSAFSGEWYAVTQRLDGSPVSAATGWEWEFLAPAIVSHPALPLPRMEERGFGPLNLAVAASVEGLPAPIVSLPDFSTPTEPTMRTPDSIDANINVRRDGPGTSGTFTVPTPVVAAQPSVMLEGAEPDTPTAEGMDAINARLDAQEAAIDELAMLVANLMTEIADNGAVEMAADPVPVN